MSPYTQNSKGINICPFASKGCSESCLVGSGFGGMFSNVKQGRIDKTEYFLNSRVEFMYQLKAEIEKAIKNNKKGITLAFRLNGTSDLSFEKYRVFEGKKNIFEIFPDTIFYDYTKNYHRFTNELPKNYHLTFSRSETNNDIAMGLLKKGINISIVFTKTPKQYKGFNVVNGDETDLTFLHPKGSIIGLKYKMITSKGADNTLGVKSGFVINTIKVEEVFNRLNEVLNRVRKNVVEY